MKVTSMFCKLFFAVEFDLGDGISLAIGSTLKDEEVTSKSFPQPF